MQSVDSHHTCANVERGIRVGVDDFHVSMGLATMFFFWETRVFLLLCHVQA